MLSIQLVVVGTVGAVTPWYQETANTAALPSHTGAPYIWLDWGHDLTEPDYGCALVFLDKTTNASNSGNERLNLHMWTASAGDANTPVGTTGARVAGYYGTTSGFGSGPTGLLMGMSLGGVGQGKYVTVWRYYRPWLEEQEAGLFVRLLYRGSATSSGFFRLANVVGAVPSGFEESSRINAPSSFVEQHCTDCSLNDGARIARTLGQTPLEGCVEGPPQEREPSDEWYWPTAGNTALPSHAGAPYVWLDWGHDEADPDYRCALVFLDKTTSASNSGNERLTLHMWTDSSGNGNTPTGTPGERVAGYYGTTSGFGSGPTGLLMGISLGGVGPGKYVTVWRYYGPWLEEQPMGLYVRLLYRTTATAANAFRLANVVSGVPAGFEGLTRINGSGSFVEQHCADDCTISDGQRVARSTGSTPLDGCVQGGSGDFGGSQAHTFGFDPYGAYSADPVNLGTGVFTTQARDLALPGRVLPLAFERWYNSADTTAGPLGPSWTHSFNWKLTDSGGTVAIRRGDGRVDTFTRQADGSYEGPPGVFDTLAKNADATYSLTLSSQVTYSFSAEGVLALIGEPAGNQISLAYADGRLVTLTDTVGRAVALSYDAAGLLAQIEDPLGRRVTYAYDPSGRLEVVTDRIGNAVGSDPSAHQWRYAYDGASAHLLTITDPDGRVRVGNTYDAQGRVVEQRDGLGELTTINYAALQTTLTDARGHQTTYSFDERLRVLTQADAVGGSSFTISYTYDALGNRTSVTDRMGQRTDLAYDGRGNVLTKTDPAPGPGVTRPVTAFEYDTRSNLTRIIDPVGFATELSYDPLTNVLLGVSRHVDAATSAITTYEYGDVQNPGLPTTIISPRGNSGPTTDPAFATSLSHDAEGNLVRRVDPDGAATTFAYDALGRLTSLVDPDGNVAGADPLQHTWTIDYDENDRETARTDPLGNVLAYQYDGAGSRTSLTDRNGNVTAYAYDANARLSAVRQRPDPTGQPALVYRTAVERDASGNATRITQGNGVVTDYAYDALDRLTSVTTYPDPQTSLVTSYDLDGNGQPTSRTTGDGVTVTYVYDAISRLTSVSAPALSIAYAYDAAGRRTEMVDATGTTSYVYDALGRVSEIAGPGGSLGYEYDLDGNRTRLGYPGGDSVSYGYSPGGRLLTVTDWVGRTSSYAYTASGLVASLAFPETRTPTFAPSRAPSLVSEYAYDRSQRLTAVETRGAGRALFSQSYALDPEGNRIRREETLVGAPPVSIDYAYDGLSRLLAAERSPTPAGRALPSESFTLDAASNLLSRTGPAATYSYDGANRLTGDGTRAFTWDGADRLIERGGDAFAYDALGRLTEATVGGVATSYSYDGDGLLRSRSDAAGAKSYLWDTSTAPAPLLAAGAERIVHGLGPLYRVGADGAYRMFVRDGLGSVRAEVDAAGAVREIFDYLAYGEPRERPYATPPLLGFAGELHDPATGLIYLRARWYDPGTGRLMTSDPLSGSQFAPESLNRYAYAAGSPSMRTDPSGLCTDPGGPGVRYCIDRFIPTGSSCVLIICFRGDNRGPMAESGAEGSRVRQLILADGSVRTISGTTRLEPFGWPAREGTVEGCTGQADPSAIDVSCSATNGLMPFAPPIHTRVKITVSNGRVTVLAAGSRYPSLEIWRYAGPGGPQMVYFYDARAAAPFDLFTIDRLPNSAGGGK